MLMLSRSYSVTRFGKYLFLQYFTKSGFDLTRFAHAQNQKSVKYLVYSEMCNSVILEKLLEILIKFGV